MQETARLYNLLEHNPSLNFRSKSIPRAIKCSSKTDFFQSVGISDATGFVSLDHTNKLIVISFRGSRSVRNFIADLNFVLVPWSICNGCSAHAGFLDSWKSVRSIVQGAVQGALTTYPNYKIVSTGHSLGGALATLAAADLRKGGYTIDLVQPIPP